MNSPLCPLGHTDKHLQHLFENATCTCIHSIHVPHLEYYVINQSVPVSGRGALEFPNQISDGTGEIPMNKIRTIIYLTAATLAFTLTGAVSSADTVVPKSRGDCPDGYRSYKGYCEPRSSRAKDVVVRNERGSCPRGYSAKKGYCYKYSSTHGDAIDKVGDDCPRGYRSYKGYCQEL